MLPLLLAFAAVPLPPQAVRSPAGNRPPVLAYERVAFSNRIRVTADDPEGRRVSLRLSNPPPATYFAPAAKEPSPVTRELDLGAFPGGEGSRLELRFEAEDEDGARAELVVPLSTPPFRASRLLVADVTGNGALDVLGVAVEADVDGVIDAGEIYVWADRADPAGAPTARLHLADPRAGDRLGAAELTRGVELFDLDGDGVLDVLAGTSGPLAGHGARAVFHVWLGGEALRGEREPDAALVAPARGLAVPEILDVTGDGVPELVVLDWEFCGGDVFPSDVRRLFVWSRVPKPEGLVPPRAVLVAGGQAGCAFAFLASFDVDLTGDGTADLALLSTVLDPDPDAVRNTLSVWAGGAGLAGVVAPAVTLTVLGAEALQVVPDVTADGVADVVALRRRNGSTVVADVFAGGDALAGDPDPLARLLAPAPWTAELPLFFSIGVHDLDDDGDPDLFLPFEGPGNGFLVWSGGPSLAGDVATSAVFDALGNTFLVDVDADGRLDLVTLLERSVEIRLGGPGLAGTVGSSTSLEVPVLSGGNRSLGTVWFADVTGDGMLDVLAEEQIFFFGGPPVPTTRVHAWAGPFPAGSVAPDAGLGISTAGFVPAGEAQLRVRAVTDVTGDGVADVLATREGVAESYVWRGGAPLSELPIARFPGSGGADGVELGDVTGDGVLDLFEVDPAATVGGQPGAGAIRVWAGGAALGGDVPPLVELASPRPGPGDGLGARAGFVAASVRLADLDGDGLLDVLAAAGEADPAGVPDAGALFHWHGPIGPPGAADGVLFVPGAAPGDGLGR